MQLIETSIAQWRSAVLRGPAVTPADADELEGHLREQITDLEAAGLAEDEAFLIAVKRLGQVDELTAEFAREHGERLWKQLAITATPDATRRDSFATMLVFATVSVVVIQVFRILAGFPESSPTWLLRDLGFFLLPALAAYFAVVRKVSLRRALVLASIVAVLALLVNVYPYAEGSATEILVAIHLPFVLWFVVGIAYLDELRSSARRMDFVRFTGEWIIYYVLIAIGGAVLLGLTAAVLTPIVPEAIDDIMVWVLPSGVAAAIIGAAWLVEAKKSIIENLAPVLTAVFTPLFAVMLLAASVGYIVVGLGAAFDRDLLTVFDVLLLVVVGLVVYGISARDPLQSAGIMDVIRLVAVAAAILLDVLVLVSMFARVGEFGLSPNRTAALGLNLILLVNLVGTAWFSVRMLARRSQPVALERWQTGFLPVFALWVTAVVLLFPPLFGFV